MAADAQANGAVTDDRVEALRKQMKQAGVDAYIVPSEDAHMVHTLRCSLCCVSGEQFVQVLLAYSGFTGQTPWSDCARGPHTETHDEKALCGSVAATARSLC